MLGPTAASKEQGNKTSILIVSVLLLCLFATASIQASTVRNSELNSAPQTAVGTNKLESVTQSKSSSYQGKTANNLVVVVDIDNPISALTKKEVIDIYMGRYKTFPDSRLVQAIDYPPGSSIKQLFYQLLVDRSERKINAYWSRLLFSGRAIPPKSTDSPEEVVSVLINNPNGLAYMPEHAVTSEMKIVYRL